MNRNELEKALTVAWDGRGIDGASLQVDSDGTIAAPAPSAADAELELPFLVSLDDSAPFAMGRTIGEGGMGLVRAAHQRDLRREVAVKMLRAGDTRAVSELLREARVTGALEHPNVVPVHALGRDDDGQPAIVMKRIEGTSWKDVLEADGREPLDRHLAILVQVARAVHFAHRRGVLHRDLKPDNVMLGEFGEVYLVDWGLAVALREGVVPELRLARDVKYVAGTPQYMAPEMAVGAGDMFGPASDVYLLGAVLHELLMGAPPHTADDVKSMLLLAFESAPKSYPEEVPAELAAIAARAMHADPAERFPDADAFASAIDAYREHRSAIGVSREAQRRLEQLEAYIADGAARDRVHGAFSECRFGFQQALRMWPNNRHAQEGLERALTTMIRFELESGSAEAAEPLLHELGDGHPQLVEDVAQALEARRVQRERLAALEREQDPTAGDRVKGALVLMQSVGWLVSTFVAGYLHDTGIYTFRPIDLAVMTLFLFVFGSVVVARWRKRVLDTDRQKRVVTYGIASVGLYTVVHLVCHWVGATTYIGLLFVMVTSIAAWLAIIMLEDRRAWPSLIVVVICLGLLLVFPSYMFQIVGVAGAVSTAWLGVAYRKSARERSF
jgi:serine/threonine-protein kinase